MLLFGLVGVLHAEDFGNISSTCGAPWLDYCESGFNGLGTTDSIEYCVVDGNSDYGVWFDAPSGWAGISPSSTITWSGSGATDFMATSVDVLVFEAATQVRIQYVFRDSSNVVVGTNSATRTLGVGAHSVGLGATFPSTGSGTVNVSVVGPSSTDEFFVTNMNWQQSDKFATQSCVLQASLAEDAEDDLCEIATGDSSADWNGNCTWAIDATAPTGCDIECHGDCNNIVGFDNIVEEDIDCTVEP